LFAYAALAASLVLSFAVTAHGQDRALATLGQYALAAAGLA
jgi:hypothetical protein